VFDKNNVPIIKAAKKYMRVTERKTQKNQKIKGQFRSAIKITKTAISKGEVERAQEYLKKSIKALDKAAQKKLLKKNTVARMKSRLNKQVKTVATAKK
jgi:small subunit ribosomal protein S20